MLSLSVVLIQHFVRRWLHQREIRRVRAYRAPVQRTVSDLGGAGVNIVLFSFCRMTEYFTNIMLLLNDYYYLLGRHRPDPERKRRLRGARGGE